MTSPLPSNRGRRSIVLATALLASGCAAPLARITTGDAVVAQRLRLRLDGNWNQLRQGMVPTATTWTVEGSGVDTLSFFIGIRDGSALAPPLPGAKDARPLLFRASMPPHEVVALMQTLLTRDGSAYTPGRLEPVDFLGTRGFRAEYQLVRKRDDVRMAGLLYGAVRGDELFLIHYTAPRLGFYPRYAGQIDAMARGARLAG